MFNVFCKNLYLSKRIHISFVLSKYCIYTHSCDLLINDHNITISNSNKLVKGVI
jgi:hypothetical protein